MAPWLNLGSLGSQTPQDCTSGERQTEKGGHRGAFWLWSWPQGGWRVCLLSHPGAQYPMCPSSELPDFTPAK